jgi:hypothetical protein
VKRDKVDEIEGPINFTLADRTTHEVDEQVWLKITDERATVVREETDV